MEITSRRNNPDAASLVQTSSHHLKSSIPQKKTGCKLDKNVILEYSRHFWFFFGRSILYTTNAHLFVFYTFCVSSLSQLNMLELCYLLGV